MAGANRPGCPIGPRKRRYVAAAATVDETRVRASEKMNTGMKSPVTRGLRGGNGASKRIRAGCSRTLDRNHTAPVGA